MIPRKPATTHFHQPARAVDVVAAAAGRRITRALAGKCRTLLSAGELAAGADCVKEAFDGVKDKATYAFTEYSDLEDATAKSCGAAVTNLREGVNSYYQALSAISKLGQNLSTDADANTAASAEVRKRRISFDKRETNAVLRCPPEK